MFQQNQSNSFEQKAYGKPEYYIHLAMLDVMNSMANSTTSQESFERCCILLDMNVKKLEAIEFASPGLFDEDSKKAYQEKVSLKQKELLASDKSFEDNPLKLVREIALHKFFLLTEVFLNGNPTDMELTN